MPQGENITYSEDKTLVDTGLLSTSEDKISNFLDKLYKTTFDNSKVITF